MDEQRPAARRRPAPGLALDLLLALLALASRLRYSIAPLDDAFLLLAVVRNALAGGGPHLLPGGDDAPLSTLLWPALVGGATTLGFDPLMALAALGLAGEIALALLARRIGERLTGSPAAGALAGAWLATSPVYLLSSLGGMETPLVLALLAFGALAALDGRPGRLAWAAGLLAWTRVEGPLLAAGLLLPAAARAPGERPDARRALAAGAALALAAPLGHRLLFGSWLPATVAAKAAVESPSLAGAGAVALELARAPLGLSAYWLVTPSVHAPLALLALVGLVRAARSPALRRATAPLLLPAALYAALFVGAGRAYAANFPWYFAPPLLAVGALVALGAAPLLARLERLRGAARLAPAGLALGLWLAAAPGLGSGFERIRSSFTAHRERAYAAAALWLGRHGPAASLASNEIGTLAWHSPRGTEIVDLFGLARRPGESGLGWLELVRRRRPEAVVTRIDFRYRRELESALPGAYAWARLGAVDVGLRADIAGRFAPFQEELPRIYFGLDLGAGGTAPPVSP